MSHTSKVKANIKDVRAIRSAVHELKRAGADISLVENEVPRMYYPNQHPAKSDLVVKCAGRYDVGLDRQKDGSYELAFDAWGGDIGKQLGNNKVQGTQQGVAKFLQTYAKYATINAAVAKGYMIGGTTTDAKGNINVMVTVPN
jgi:hypothetical protein